MHKSSDLHNRLEKIQRLIEMNNDDISCMHSYRESLYLEYKDMYQDDSRRDELQRIIKQIEDDMSHLTSYRDELYLEYKDLYQEKKRLQNT